MQHQNSVFHSLIKHIPWTEFDRIVLTQKSDFRVRQLDTKSQFLAMLYAQMSGASSLREIEAGLNSHKARLYHIGAKKAARSTLSDANANRPWKVFGELFTHMVLISNRKSRRNMSDAVRIIDATKIKLSGSGSQWARFSDDFCAAKVHLVYDPNDALPLEANITPFNVNDITPAKELKIETGVTYVFDLGYYDYGWWAKMHKQGCYFVTRLKNHTELSKTTDIETEKGSNILSEHIGFLPKRRGHGRVNPMDAPLRELKVRISTGKIIRIVTNDLNAPANDIAELYKQRWQIELFFKWVKQNLQIKHLLGRSENAVRIQVFTALIAYLLLKIVYEKQSSVKSASTFTHLICLNLMHRKSVEYLNKPYIPPPADLRQSTMKFYES